VSISVAGWSFPVDGALHPYIFTFYPGDYTTLAMFESVDVESVGEKLTTVYVDLRNATNTTTLQTLTYGSLSTKSYNAAVNFTNLTPGTTYQLRIRATGTVSGTGVIASRRFVWAVGEIVYPVSLGTSPTSIALEYELYNPTANTVPPEIGYAPASGPLVGNITGPFTSSPPAAFSAPAYVHIRVRLYDDTQLSRMDFTWRAS